MAKGGCWVRRTIKCKNGMRYKSQFWDGPRRPRKDRRAGSSSLAQKDRNANTAPRRLAMLLNCNFTGRDCLLTLTYSDEHLPADPDAADAACRLFFRRLIRECQKMGLQLSYVWTTADKSMRSGHVGDPVRLHHHIVVSGLDLERLRPLEEIWGQGFVNVKRLEEHPDMAPGQVPLDPIAAYLALQAVTGPGRQKWHSSRGMEKPEVVKVETLAAPEPMKTPAGAVVMDMSDYDPETGTHFMAYYLAPRKRRRKKEAENGEREAQGQAGHNDTGQSKADG